MDSKKAEKLIQAGLDKKADFVELFIEETRSSSVSYSNQKIETATAGTNFGIGIRLIYGTEVFYATTSNDEEDHLLKLIDALSKTKSDITKEVTGIVYLREKQLQNLHQITLDPRKIGQEKKLSYLKLADLTARSFSTDIVQVNARLFDSVSNIMIYNSEGLFVKDLRTHSRFSLGVTAEKSGERFSASEAPGAQRGFEFVESLDIKAITTKAVERALLMLSAGYVKGKKMPVVMGNGFGGVIFHEACGHPLETEAIRKKASPFVGKLNQQIAQSCLTAIDEGHIPNSWGSISIDDEGHEVEKTVLIENGILKNYLSDRIGAEEVGVRRTGSARRESYQYSPVSRMRNTYIANGKDKLEDMISSISDGLYAKKMGGGSVNPATGEFNFAVEEAYLIENGKITKPVRGATLIGKGDEIISKISMVADDLEITAGMCGASSGSIPVTVGQPSLKVDEILVGGR
jgi:TldD protein